MDGYDSATFVAIIDQPPRPAELARLGDLLNQVNFETVVTVIGVTTKFTDWFCSYK